MTGTAVERHRHYVGGSWEYTLEGVAGSNDVTLRRAG